jgi:hypothetical protein
MGLRHPRIYIFPRGLWNKNTKPMTRAPRAAMMGDRKNSRQDAKNAKSGIRKFQNSSWRSWRLGERFFCSAFQSYLISYTKLMVVRVSVFSKPGGGKIRGQSGTATYG